MKLFKIFLLVACCITGQVWGMQELLLTIGLNQISPFFNQETKSLSEDEIETMHEHFHNNRYEQAFELLGQEDDDIRKAAWLLLHAKKGDWICMFEYAKMINKIDYKTSKMFMYLASLRMFQDFKCLTDDENNKDLKAIQEHYAEYDVIVTQEHVKLAQLAFKEFQNIKDIPYKDPSWVSIITKLELCPKDLFESKREQALHLYLFRENFSLAKRLVTAVFEDSNKECTQGEKQKSLNDIKFCSHCSTCNKNKNENEKLQRCKRCKITYYCDTTCQLKNWSQHKIFCNAKKKERKSQALEELKKKKEISSTSGLLSKLTIKE